MNKILFAILTCSSLFSGALYSQTIFVKNDGTGNGSSWKNAAGNLQEALEMAASGDEIWVEKGSYFPTSCNPCLEEDRTKSFEVPIGVAIYGGFLGSETQKSDRSPDEFSTLNGDIGILGDRSDNSYSILTLEYPTNQNIIDGFIFKNGNADGDGSSSGPGRSGGAIYIDGHDDGGSASPIIFNCQFYNNRATTYGGAINFYAGNEGSCTINIEHCRFEGNYCEEKGGALAAYGAFEGSITGQINNSTFYQNRTEESGGAVIINSSRNGSAVLTLFQNTFDHNSATTKGGAILFEATDNGINTSVISDCQFNNNAAKRGGGAYTDSSESGLCDINYLHCVFRKNIAESGGGAVHTQSYVGVSNPLFQNCLFEANFSDEPGGALFNSGQEGLCQPIIDKCHFKNNETNSYGAGMYNFGKTGMCSPIVTNCLFTGNISDSGSSIYNYGGGIGMSNPKIVNCTFTKNIARVGPCIYNQAGDVDGTVKPFVSNCIFWDNTATSGYGLVFQSGHSDPTIQYSLVPFDECDDLNTQPNSNLTCLGGMIYNEDPEFLDPDNFDFRLAANSPALNTGLMDTVFFDNLDLDARLREIATIDIGAYEQDQSAHTIISRHPIGGTFCEKEAIELNINTAGQPATDFQWIINNSPISGATTPILNISNLQSAHAGNYWCEVTGSNGMLYSDTIEVFVKNAVTPTIELIADAEEYCAGDTVRTVTAVISHEGFFNEYDWELNGNGQPQENLTFNFNVQNNDILTFNLSSSEVCLSGDATIDEEIIFTEQNVVDAEIEITSTLLSYCEGENILIEANTVNGGNLPEITWFLNSGELNISTSSIELNNLEHGDFVTAELTSSLACTSQSNVSSNSLTFEILPIVDPAIQIASEQLTYCAGENVLIETTVINGGNEPEYTWFLNDVDLNLSTANIELENLEEGDVITAELNSSLACTSQSNVSSNTLTFEITPLVNPTIAISSERLTYCAGENVLIETTIANGGIQPEYKWFLNDVDLNLSTANIELENLVEGDIITAELNSSLDCISTSNVSSNTLTFEIASNLNPAIAIASEQLTYCTGENVLIESTVTNGGSQPEYKWFLNDVELNLSTASIELENLEQGDIITAELISSLTCVSTASVSSNTLTFEITPIVDPTIEISSEQLSYCAGENVLIEATTLHGGNDPEFTWILNGEDLSPTTFSIELDDLEQGDIITAQLTSSLACVSDPLVSSNTLTFEIYDVVSPAIELSAPAGMHCIDSTLTLSVVLENEGDDPNISWWIDAEEVATGSELTLDYIFNEVGVKNLEARLISSEQCVDVQEVVAIAQINVEACTTTFVNQLNTSAFNLFPNPSTGLVQIDGDFSKLNTPEISLISLSGLKMIDRSKVEIGQSQIKLDLSSFHAGMYFVKILDSTGTLYLPLILNK